MKKIIYYQKENGEIPVEDFLVALAWKNFILANKIRSKILALSIWRLWNQDVKYIEDKIYELRVRDKNNISRVFYFSHIGENIILLDAIMKKDQKLKRVDIVRAIKYKDEYIKNFWEI